MILRMPAYYEAFSCVASACMDSCCKGWEIAVDADSAARYRAMEGALGEDLRSALFRDETGEFSLRLVDGRCPMWRTDGLCRIQAECGEAALCQTCRDFPRLTHDYGDFAEYGLELSCPEAARLIFENPNAAWTERVVPGGEQPPYDRADMELLRRTRENMLEILADTRRDVRESLALALLYGYEVQRMLDGERGAWDAPQALDFARSIAVPCDGKDILAFYRELDILSARWRARLQSPCENAPWDERLRTLARCGVERYYLQSISDFDIVGRVKMTVLSCIVVQLLGGDTVQTAQQYSAEIDNSADNVEAILDGAYESPALTDARLLGRLLL